ncbi:slam [Drosophila busckii]|uniref:Slam n=1 Tax=Drosophila busckii TaxID=30019 RepID=A0A0M4EBZ4_DROBS|nr:slam [Drosophila busckii]
MVLSNSTPNSNHNKQHELLHLDTAAINSADFSELLQLNAEIEQRRSRNGAQCSDASEACGLLRATMMREELFEVSSLDDDRFLTALEHQNSYVTPSRVQVTDLDLSSIENLMKYFDEEVPTTPSKQMLAMSSCTGKVASAIAKLANQPETPAKQKPTAGKQKISELKQRYEQSPEQQQQQQQQLATPQAPRGGNRLPMKVREIAQLFNSKINQVMGRAEPPQYATLHNELSLSPEIKKTKPKVQPPTPKPRQQLEQTTCLVAEDVFRELSVKDKILLFDKFVSDIATKHPKFNEHADDLKAQAKKQMARGEVIAEQQARVKDLAKELEAKCVLQTTTTTPPRPQASTKPTTPSLHVSTLTVIIKPNKERHLIASPSQSEPLAQREPGQKRNLAEIRSRLPTEAYAPPKKIRRTRQERAGQMFFQNEPLESLFYSWLSAENGVLFDITSASNHEQTIEIASSDEQPAMLSQLSEYSQKSAVERLLEEAIAKLDQESKTKESLQLEQKDVDTASSVSVKSTPRKLKRQAPPVPAPRPSLTQQSSCITSSSASSCKQSDAESESGLSTLPKITSDESQPEMLTTPVEAENFDFPKPQRPPRKKKLRRTLTWKKENSIVEATANAVTSTDSDSDYKPKKKSNPAPATPVALPRPEQSYIELDKSLMRHVNSPRKIKSAYTLTVLSPSPTDQSPLQTPRQSLEQSQPATDSFVDQGFETCSNDASPLRRSSVGLSENKPSGFSTPVKARSQLQLFSPLAQDKARRSSLAMQVIREDHPLDLAESSDAPNTPTCSEREFFANAPTVEMSSSQLDDFSSAADKPQSKFWISAGDFTVSLDIAYNTPERLRLLYEIFTQKSWETQKLTFGIDKHKFCRAASQETCRTLPERQSSDKDFSHYWFGSGDVTVPFSGRHLSSEKIERLFRFLDAELAAEPERELRFGVDQFEFSSVPEFWPATPKFSIASSYGMLVGLQAGQSNGLEGRSKYAWPNSSGIKTSDLDQTEFESDSFGNNSGRLSFSPDLFSQEYEAVPLDELFDKTLPLVRSTPIYAQSMSMPQMLRTLQQQQSKLKSVEQRIRNFELPANLTEETLKKCRSNPQYAQKLQAIDKLARNNGFSACSMEELESYMQFLIEYADVCLGSCSEHMDKIIDTLLDRRAVQV